MGEKFHQELKGALFTNFFRMIKSGELNGRRYMYIPSFSRKSWTKEKKSYDGMLMNLIEMRREHVI